MAAAETMIAPIALCIDLTVHSGQPGTGPVKNIHKEKLQSLYRKIPLHKAWTASPSGGCGESAKRLSPSEPGFSTIQITASPIHGRDLPGDTSLPGRHPSLWQTWIALAGRHETDVIEKCNQEQRS